MEIEMKLEFKYRVQISNGTIKKHRVIRFTESDVCFLSTGENYYKVNEKRESASHIWLDTLDDAKNFLLHRFQSELVNLNNAIEYYTYRIKIIQALTEQHI